MQAYGEDSVVSGQLSDWGIIYEKIIGDYYEDKWSNEDIWWLMKEKATFLGGEFDQIINPKFVDDLRGVEIDEPELGEISAYDLIVERLEQMTKGGPEEFDPFEGPIYDNKGNLQIPEGSRASKGDLLSIMYYVDNVVGDIPSS
jgi:simple sugar transport system substrate-binding protein